MFRSTCYGGHRVMRYMPALAGNAPRPGLIRWAGEVLGHRTSRGSTGRTVHRQRRVSVCGAIMIGGQRIQAGLPHAGKTVETDTYHITVADGILIAAPRKTSRAINRHKASDYG